jgi:RNA polymerase sigma-70 factor (ECF subfamily)
MGEPFLPWAFTIARFQVLANIRDKKRDRCLLDEELVNALASVVEEETSRLDEHRTALRACMKKLNDKNLKLLRRRYFGGRSIQQLAATSQRGESAIKVALMRIRQSLAACIQNQMNETTS